MLFKANASKTQSMHLTECYRFISKYVIATFNLISFKADLPKRLLNVLNRILLFNNHLLWKVSI